MSSKKLQSENELAEEYELLDFGNGRKLERFGELLLNRPAPSAESDRPALPQSDWAKANFIYERTSPDSGKWKPKSKLPKSWVATVGGFQFDLRPSPFGHVGVFAEQAENWAWIAKQVKRANRPIKVLNLFAYSGGSTLAAAAAGAEVTHVDSAKNIVARARGNAELNGLADHPIKWIVEDVKKYCQREVKRGNFYDAVILDPPTYGHGTKDEVWRISDDFLPLLRTCAELTSNGRTFFLASCHSSGIGPAELGAYLSDGIFGSCAVPPKCGPMTLKTTDGRRLNAGVFARIP